MERVVETTNTLMLADPSVDGVKTGHTLDAGYVLVASAKRKGIPLLSVVLGAPSEAERDAESERLLDYGYSQYKPQTPIAYDDELATASVKLRGRAAVAGRRREGGCPGAGGPEAGDER